MLGQVEIDWVWDNSHLLVGLFSISVMTLALTAIVLPFVISRLPHDYFQPAHRRRRVRDEPTFTRIFLHVLKNIAGLALLISGIAMLVLPGQGLLTILIGLVLVDFPHKYEVERRLVRVPSVFRAINWLRRRSGKRMFEVPSG